MSRSRFTVVSLLIVTLSLAAGIIDRHVGLAGQYGGSVRSASLTLAEQAEAYGDHFTPYAVLRSSAPEGQFVLNADAAAVVSTAQLYAVTRARDVRTEPGSPLGTRSDAPDRTIEHGGRLWSFWIDDAAPGTEFQLDVVPSVDGLEKVRIVQSSTGEEVIAKVDQAGADVLRRLGVSPEWIEVLLYTVLALAGGLVIPRAGALPRLARPPIALIVGVACIGALGMFRLPGAVSLFVGVSILVLLGRRLGPLRTAWTAGDALPLTAFLTLIAWTVLVTRRSGSVVVSLDSFDYLIQAHELAAGRLSPGDLSLKRGAFLQGLYALGFGIGVDFLVAPSVVLLVAATVLLGSFGITRTVNPLARTAILGVAALPWFHVQTVSLARYVNSHVVLAVGLLALAVLAQYQAEASNVAQEAFVPSLAILAGSLVFLRAEAVFLVALFLLGAARAHEGRLSAIWRALGLATFAWGASLALGAVWSGMSGSRLSISFMVLGVGFVAVPAVERLAAPVWRRAPVVLMILLWAWTLILTSGPGRRATSFVNSVYQNLAEGQGRWGLLAPVLALLALLALGAGKGAADRAGLLGARVLLAGFIPISLLSKLGDGAFGGDRSIVDWLFTSAGGGRVGWGDSMNRMWMHIALIICLLLISVIVNEASSTRNVASSAAAKAMLPQRTRGLVFGSLAVAVATLWNPYYVASDLASRDDDRMVVRDVSARGAAVVGELVDGRVVEQIFFLDPWHDVSEPGRSSICVGLTFVTFGRENAGVVDVEMAFDRFTTAVTIDASSIVDWGSERICLPVNHESRPDGRGVVRIRGRSTEPGRAVSLVGAEGTGATGGGFLPPAIVRAPGDPLGTPLPGPLAIEVDVLREPAPEIFQIDLLVGQFAPRAVPGVLALLLLLVLVPSPRENRGRIERRDRA